MTTADCLLSLEEKAVTAEKGRTGLTASLSGVLFVFNFVKLSFFNKKIYWHIVDVQCGVSFKCTAE